MKKNFKIKNIVPFNLLRWEIDTFYSYLDQEYFSQFNICIEILEADLNFIKDGIEVKIITYNKGQLWKIKL